MEYDMGKSVYFDHAAASIPSKEVLDFYGNAAGKYFANPEAVHDLAYRVKRELTSAAERLSMLLFDRSDYPVIWGNSATELFGMLASFPEFTASAASLLEHPALLANLRSNTRFSHLPVTRRAGIIVPEQIPGDLPLACTHQVQSELGSMPQCGKLFSLLHPRCRMLDAVQAAGKMKLDKNSDIWVISGVKFGSPGGAAMLLAPDGAYTGKLLEYAGFLRKELYAVSRINVPEILTMVFAAEKAVAAMDENFNKVSEINRFLRRETAELGITPTLEADVDTSPYILNLLLPSQESAVVVRALGKAGIYTASGSACSAESGKPPLSLTAMGVSAKKAYRALRLSFGAANTPEDAEKFLAELKIVLKNY